MDFVNKQDAVGLVLQRLQDALEALLEVTPVLGARQQGAHVERINLRLGQNFRHIFLRDAPGQTLGNRRLSYAGLAHQQRVVLAAAAQNLNNALDLVVAANQRVNLAFLGQLVEVDGVLLQWRSFLVLLATFFVLGSALAGLGGLGRVAFLDAVGNVIDHVQACDALLVQVVDGVGVFFAKNGDQHVGAGDFLLAAAGGLHMHDGALNHPLETQRGLRIHIVAAGDLGRVVFDEVGKCLAQIVNIGGAGAQHFGCTGVVQKGQQQVFNGDELVALLACLDKGHVQADF